MSSVRWLCVLLLGCGSEAPADQDAEPPFSAEEHAIFSTLSPAVDSLPAPPIDPTNRFADDPAAAALGEALFFEPRFSGRLLDGDHDGSPGSLGSKGETGKVACASCHAPEAAYGDNRSFHKQISLGAGWTLRHTPSLLDVGQARLLMWDGSKDTLYNQIFGPLESVVEMNSSRLFMAQQAYRIYRAEYEAIFGPMPPLDQGERFPALSAEDTGCQPTTLDPELTCNGTFHGMPGDGAEYDSMSQDDQDAVTGVVVNLGKAIGAFERSLTCGTSRFDAWVHGDTTALSASEQRGAKLFIGRGGCVGCHSGPFFTDQAFHNVGLKPVTVQVTFLDANDKGAHLGIAAALANPLNSASAWSDGDDGRLPAVVDESMLGAFRTPSLRCTAAHPTYMHTGQFYALGEVVDFFSRGGDEFGYPGVNETTALGLTLEERTDLVAFLGTLGGVQP